MARRDRPVAMPAWLPFTVDTWDKQACKKKRHHFLTHAHTDHLAGIEHFKTRERTIYCSQITRDLVVRHFPQLGNATFCLLEVDGGEQIIHEPGCRISVRAFDANHCPGAIMLLFYVEEHGYILHTGDARLSEARVVRPVKAFLRKKPLKCLYLDCTYGNKANDFPSKEDAIAQVCTFIACQTEDDQQVFLACDQLGMEEVLEGVLQKFGVRFWIDQSNASASALSWWDDLRAMHPDWLAGSPSATRFHLCDSRALGRRVEEVQRNAWRSSGPPPVFIRPSSQFFLHGDDLEGDAETARGMNLMLPVGAYQQAAVARRDDFGSYRVLFSMHSSRAELMEAIKILSPKHVVNFVGEMDNVLKAVVDKVTKGTSNDQWVRPSQRGQTRERVEASAEESENDSGVEEVETHHRGGDQAIVEAPILSLDNTPSLEQIVNDHQEAPLSPPVSYTSSQGADEQQSPALERTPQNDAGAARNLSAALDRETLPGGDHSLERSTANRGDGDLQERTESRAETEVLGDPPENRKQSGFSREGEECNKRLEAATDENLAAKGRASPDHSPTKSCRANGEERVELHEMYPSERLRGGSAVPDGGVEAEANCMDVEGGLKVDRGVRESNRKTRKEVARNSEDQDSDSEEEHYQRGARKLRRRLSGLYHRDGFLETGYEPRRCNLCPRRYPLDSERTYRDGGARKRRASSIGSPKRATPKKSANTKSDGNMRAFAALGVAQPIPI